jgi:tetratricopeptide (TPR) repeat protein
LIVALLGLVTQLWAADAPLRVSLDDNEALFTVLTAINYCGFDVGLGTSDPLRSQIRAEVAKAVEASAEAKESGQVMCQFYTEHQQAEPARTLAQYVSLALNLGPPPAFTLKVKEADLPPDASYVSGLVPIVQKFYGEAGLQVIWTRHQPAYNALTERYHEPLSKELFDTEVYLKIPSAAYLGRTFTVFLEPMGTPGEANARNYGTDYYVVISPGTGAESGLKMEQIRHTYLHYLLDPLALKYPAAMERLKPLLGSVKGSPMDESFRNDVSLLATECLIRAIEARSTWTGKTPDAQMQQLVQQSVEQGFILTPYFYDALAQFEKSPIGLKTAYPDLMNNINVSKEEKNAAQVKFASTADEELLHLSRHTQGKLLLTAQQRLASGDPEGAKKLAQQALDEKSEDSGRALFILAQVATMNRDMQGARSYFEQAIGAAKEPSVVAWSHIYLGRICDLQEDRAAALVQYRAALSAGESLPEAKAAAERGIAQPYEPPSHPQ